jgi:hypothetical protein
MLQLAYNMAQLLAVNTVCTALVRDPDCRLRFCKVSSINAGSMFTECSLNVH